MVAQQPKLAHPQFEVLLRWAATLHEVDLNINHRVYIAIRLMVFCKYKGFFRLAFNQEQQMMMATLVRYHCKAINWMICPAFTPSLRKQYSAVNLATSAGRIILEQPAAGDHHAADAAANDR